MKTKPILQGIAALLILIFHLYIPFTGTKLEASLVQGSYIGVDLFFLVSAASLRKVDLHTYPAFIRNRFRVIYLPFLCFALLAAVYEHWSIRRLLCVISGLEFIQRGGGSFLWFLPGLLGFYLAVLLWLFLKQHASCTVILALILLWGLLAAATQYVFHQEQLLIWINRIPVFTLGFFYEPLVQQFGYDASHPRQIHSHTMTFLLSGPGLIASIYLFLRFGSLHRLSYPIHDLFYVTSLPFILLLVLLIEGRNARHPLHCPFLRLCGACSLELYALQMILGYPLETQLLRWLGQRRLLSFLCTIALLLPASCLLNRIRKSWLH